MDSSIVEHALLVPQELPQRLYEPFMLFAPWQCEELIKYAQTREMQQGIAGGKLQSDVRNNTVTWIDLHELYWKWMALFEQFDEADTLWLQEPFQISSYSQNQSYAWHRDDDVRKSNSTRTYTLTCTLASAPDAVFQTRTRTYDLEPGWAVIIPSAVEHRATAPSSGERWSFTVWCMKRLNSIS